MLTVRITSGLMGGREKQIIGKKKVGQVVMRLLSMQKVLKFNKNILLSLVLGEGE
jgi:hypothetical protein